MECEARYVVNLPGKFARQQYLELVEKRRGTQALGELRAAVMIEWSKLKSKRREESK